MEDRTQFGRSRFAMRLYYFALAILKKSKKFDERKIDEHDVDFIITQSLDVATEEELEVIDKLMQLINTMPEDDADQCVIFTASLEGTLVVVGNLDPKLLLEARAVLSDDNLPQPQSKKKKGTQPSVRKKTQKHQ